MASAKMERKRNANMDLLRMLSMLMVTMLHALTKSDLLLFMGSEVPVNGWIAWVLEALSVSSVNIFMLISGYFLISSKFKIGRLLEIVLQTMFYLVGAVILFLLLGKFSLEGMDIYKFLDYLLPIHMETYWFISAYVIIYMLLPLITGGVHAMSEKQLQRLIVILFVYECVIKSILPVRVVMDKRGYSFLWYLILFLIGAYIRRYGFKIVKTAKRGWFVFIVSTVLIFAEIFILSRIQVQTGRLKEMTMVSLDYNHILVFLAAVGIFAAFLHAKPLGEKFGKIVCLISPYCLGVYLLQENLMMRYSWQDWFGLREAMEQPVYVFLLRVFGAVVVMFVLGICVDALRSALFRGVTKLVCRKDKV